MQSRCSQVQEPAQKKAAKPAPLQNSCEYTADVEAGSRSSLTRFPWSIGNTSLVARGGGTADKATATPFRLQPKLRIGAVDDPLEHEADRIADRAMQMRDAAPRSVTSLTAGGVSVRRKCSCGGSCESCSSESADDEHGTVQRKPAAAAAQAANSVAPPIVHDVLCSPGRPLDAATRKFFEPRLGRDLGGVRVHADARAAESAARIHAHAYTVGHNVVFAPGQFGPQTEKGKRLLAHELSHVLQQSQGGAPPALVQRKCACGSTASATSGDCPACAAGKKLQRKARVGGNDDPLEHEADRAAERVLKLPGWLPAANVRTLPPVYAQRPAADAGGNPLAPASGPALRRQAENGLTDGAAAAAGRSPLPVSESAAEYDESLTQGGLPLEPELRSFFEGRYGRDLSEVRLHMGAGAEARNDALNAHAFTYGNHIWLGRGHRPRADFLLAHELAHVLQQRQPRELMPDDAGEGTRVETVPQDGGRVIRRMGLSEAFWVPLGGKGKRTGGDLHEELLAIAQANNPDLDIEAPAPNAIAGGWGLGLQGSMDLYKGSGAGGLHALVGLFFDGTTGAQTATVPPAIPRNVDPRRKSASKGGKFNPFVTAGGSIGGISQGPTSVEVGELKPASAPLLDKGRAQIGNYREGMRLASRLTNEWAKGAGVSDRWNLSSASQLPDSAVKFVRGGVDMKFNPGSARDDENLVLAKIVEKSGGSGYKFDVTFNPAAEGLPPVKGGLYAQSVGSGLWIYFARPKDLTALLGMVRQKVGAEMTEANLAQEQIINPLVHSVKKTASTTASAAPPKKSPLLRDRSRVALDERAAPAVGRDSAPAIRRKPTTPELQDEFSFAVWTKNQEALRDQLFGSAATEDTRKKVASLELLEEAYHAEDALDRVPGTGHSTLPAKSTDVVKIFTGAGGSKKLSGTRNLADMASWLKGWTSRPAQVLGFFREKFGGAFVWVANKFTALRDRIREKWQKAFEAHPSKPGGSKGKIIVKALLKALMQIAKIVLPRSLHLFMDAVVAGIQAKLSKVFDIDPLQMAEDAFGEPFKQWNDQLTTFQDDAQTYVDKLVSQHERELTWIKDVMDLANRIGTILEVASVAIQCGKKPGWNCLLLLSQHFRECGMEAALNTCIVQKEIASVVAALGPLADLPATLAQKGLDVVRDAAPKGLEDVFKGPVPHAGAFNNDDVECEDSKSELTCPGFIPLGGGGQGILPDDKKEDSEKGGDPKNREEPRPPQPPQPPQPPTWSDDPGSPDGSQAHNDQPGVYGPDGGKGESHGKPSNATGGDNPQGAPGMEGGGDLPGPGEVHKALNDLLNDQGPEGMAALARLAEAAGMPGNAPLSAEQVKKLQELLKKGKLTSAQLKKIAEEQGKGDLQGRARPPRKFLETEAHGAVLDQTLDKMRKKEYEFQFQEMARLKMHWKILTAYKPGPFRNAPALMWDDTIRAAGVVDGEFGKCSDGGKVSLTVTKADMREEGTEKPAIVHTPFHDKAAQVAGGACPAPPPPKGGKSGGAPKDDGKGSGGQGQSSRQGGAEGDKGEKQPSPPPGGKGGAGKGGAEEQRGQEQKPPDEGGAGNEVDSGVKPGDSGDPVGSGKKGGNKDREEHKEKPNTPETGQPQQPADQKPELDVPGLAEGCGLPAKCAADTFLVDFEEAGEAGDGWQVMPDKGGDPDSTMSLRNPPNKVSPFSLRPAGDKSQEQELVLTCEGKTCVVGKVVPSQVRAGMVELVSGALLDSLRALLRQFIQKKRHGRTGRAERIHFF